MGLTQKQTVLAMLKAAGKFGVRSDTYIRDYMPRAAARIQEVKDEGYNITSEREGKYTRWTLQEQRGVADVRTARGVEANPPGASAWAGNRSERTTGTEQAEESGDKTEVPAAAPEDLSLFEETSYERLQDAA